MVKKPKQVAPPDRFTIPLSFVPGSRLYEEHHLEYSPIPGGTLVKWPAAGVTIRVPGKSAVYPDFVAIEKANAKRVSFIGLSGFSIGSKYHEILVGGLPGSFAFKMGKMEISFGEASPLMVFLFDKFHDNEFYGEWDDISTIRILGGEHDNVELIFINAALRYGERFGVVPTPMAMEPYEKLTNNTPRTKKRQLHTSAIADLHPLRFYFYGELQQDPASACVYFYRVLEYYSFLTNWREVSRLRRDRKIGPDEFTKKIFRILAKDDRSAILRVVNSLTDKHTLDEATKRGLINQRNAALLGEAIYRFRNSIVHGKETVGKQLQSNPVFSRDNVLDDWRDILRRLASRALSKWSSKLA